eukprot:TRINITY_DN17499_c1_g1_i1.p1 TRINITY_DN17499_c1_g1~~TRINITY_DN17499_c1_g1_i1.p1  ORF type:complete len:677 (-),score=145.87 TRINITY_DN17499_c1_g1_i1:69-2099(-)
MSAKANGAANPKRPRSRSRTPPLRSGGTGPSDVESWLMIVSEDWRRLDKAPSEIRGTPDVIAAALRESKGEALRLASQELRADAEYLLGAMKEIGAKVLAHAALSLRSDRDFIVEAAQDVGAEVLAHCSPKLRADTKFVMEVADFCTPGDLLQHAPASVRTELLGDREFVREAVHEVGADVLAQASRALCGDRQFMLDLSESFPGGEILQHATDELQESLYSDGDFIMRAVQESGAEVLEFASMKLRSDRAFMLRVDAMCPNKGEALQYAADELRASLDPTYKPALPAEGEDDEAEGGDIQFNGDGYFEADDDCAMETDHLAQPSPDASPSQQNSHLDASLNVPVDLDPTLWPLCGVCPSGTARKSPPPTKPVSQVTPGPPMLPALTTVPPVSPTPLPMLTAPWSATTSVPATAPAAGTTALGPTQLPMQATPLRFSAPQLSPFAPTAGMVAQTVALLQQPQQQQQQQQPQQQQQQQQQQQDEMQQAKTGGSTVMMVAPPKVSTVRVGGGGSLALRQMGAGGAGPQVPASAGASPGQNCHRTVSPTNRMAHSGGRLVPSPLQSFTGLSRTTLPVPSQTPQTPHPQAASTLPSLSLKVLEGSAGLSVQVPPSPSVGPFVPTTSPVAAFNSASALPSSPQRGVAGSTLGNVRGSCPTAAVRSGYSSVPTYKPVALALP